MAKDLIVNYEGKPCYSICIRNDFNDLLPTIKEKIGKNYDNICIVSDSNVAGLYLKDLIDIFKETDSNISSFSFDAGEESKNLDTVNLLYEHLIFKRFTRKSLLVALGGGVVGDLTGFAASTFLRGIDFIQVPTTLLAQVDSSVGGKTGVDYKGFKNMVGAFYMPKLVYMNLSTLKSLDATNFTCGMGEVIKHGLIADKDFYQWIKDNIPAIKARDLEALEHLVYTNCDIKRYVVEIDPKEQGIRAYLNFGHTVGHAIEKLCCFTLGHGQCVGLGMISAMYLSKKLGYISDADINDMLELFKEFDFPTKVSNLDAGEILDATKSDKKMAGKKINFTILKEIGKADSYLDFTDEELLESIRRVL